MYKINKRGKGPNKSGGSDFFQKKLSQVEDVYSGPTSTNTIFE